MTISSTTRRAGPFPGNASATAFPFSFKVFAATDVLAYTTAANVTTPLVINVDYSVALNADQSTSPGGTVTYPLIGSAMPVGTSLSLSGQVPYTQTAALPGGGNFSPTVIETALDRATMQIQQINDAVTAGVAPGGVTLTGLPNAAARAGYLLGFDSSGNPIIVAPVAGTATALAIDLALAASATKGAGQVGWNYATAYAFGLVGSKLNSIRALYDTQPAGDGITDDSTKLSTISTVAAKGNLDITPGVFLCDPFTVPAAQMVRGVGWTATAATRPGATLLKRSNGQQILMSGDHAGLTSLHIDGNKAGGKTGDGVQMAATRQRADNVSSVNQTGVGFRIGGAGATGVFNANLWGMIRPIARSNTGDGCYLHHSGGTVTAQFPNGTPDCNAGVMVGGDFGLNGGRGLALDNSIDNLLLGPAAQTNTGKGITLSANSLGNVLIKPYAEANNGGAAGYGDEIDITSGAYNNIILGSRTTGLASGSGVRDQCAPGKNLVITYENPLGSFAVRGKWAVWNELADATGADLNFFKGAGQANIANHLHTITGTSGGLWSLQTKIDGGAVTTRLDVNAVGLARLQNTTGGLLVGKSVADTTTAGIQIGDTGSGTNSRINMVGSASAADTKIAFYNSNGLVGSISTSASATTYATSSDYRLKRDAEDVDGEQALAAVMSWPVKSFVWKATGERDIGFIAHELGAVKPGAVHGDKDAVECRELHHSVTETVDEEIVERVDTKLIDADGAPIYRDETRTVERAVESTRCEQVHSIVPQGVDFSKLVPELVAAMQHQARVIEALEKRVAALEAA